MNRLPDCSCDRDRRGPGQKQEDPLEDLVRRLCSGPRERCWWPEPPGLVQVGSGGTVTPFEEEPWGFARGPHWGVREPGKPRMAPRVWMGPAENETGGQERSPGWADSGA